MYNECQMSFREDFEGRIKNPQFVNAIIVNSEHLTLDTMHCKKWLKVTSRPILT